MSLKKSRPFLSPSPRNQTVGVESSNIPAADSVRKSNQTSAALEDDDHGDSNNEHKLKRIAHRDTERQRRQEMANLHASLRALLPLEYIKGKRSISDHMHEAVNYIKHLQERISELRLNKEKLMKMPNSRTCLREKVGAKSYSDSRSSVMASPCQDGVEILISSSLSGDVVFPLSIVLKKLLLEGLDVVSCVSTKANETTFYRIISQADDPSSIDIVGLRKKLEDVFNQGSPLH